VVKQNNLPVSFLKHDTVVVELKVLCYDAVKLTNDLNSLSYSATGDVSQGEVKAPITKKPRKTNKTTTCLNTDVARIASQVEANSAAISQLKDMPNKINMILGLLTDDANANTTQDFEFPNTTEGVINPNAKGAEADVIDPLLVLLDKSHSDGMQRDLNSQ